MKETLVFRVDASSEMGIGHMMRCLALAQAWQDIEGHSIFVMSTRSPGLETRLKSEGMNVVYVSAKPGSDDDAFQTTKLSCEMNTRWVIVDGYHFTANYQKSIKDSGLNLLFIDDHRHADHYYADIVLNQNIHAENLFYRCEPYTQFFLGPEYVLLRREFLKWRGWARSIPEVARCILVTLGGGDSENVTLKVIQALREMNQSEMEVTVLIGPTNPHLAAVESEISSFPCPIRLLVSADQVPELMAHADVAVSAAGSTSWELAFMQLPAVLLILADNQRPIAESLEQKGVTLNGGWGREVLVEDLSQDLLRLIQSQTARFEMSSRGRQCVDGGGTGRIVHALRTSRNFRSVANAHSLSR